ncbi:2-hydroxymuconate tautomerase [Neptuniibacter halophilus]|uniref:2-hydroxymuconate tautomerase n=1 Tax=Neptuniibacter halophilus TaxID=651666 RepID=UPI00257419FE|nr:2-hydroxymuconate tautomerase [Neptuniibacter halophilus]
MPIAQIQMMEGRTPEQKEALIRKVTDAIMLALDAPEPSVRVLINEIPKPHFGIGGVAADKLGR